MTDRTEAESAQCYRDRLRDVGDTPGAEAPFLTRSPRKSSFNPYRMLAGTFLALIAVGAFLLNTPWAQTSGLWAWERVGMPFSWSVCWRAALDNLFMATSASCVTGLAVVDVPSTYTGFGQAVLLGCIQVGGLSLVTLGTMIVSILLGRVPFGGEKQLVLSFGTDASGGRTRSLLAQTFYYVFGFEAFGTFVLFLCYRFHHGYAVGEGLWHALFHSVSAFCNAGISLHSANLLAMRGDVLYMLTIAVLVAAGGLGFLVLSNVFQYRFWRRDLRRRGRISLHTRIVLWMSLILSVGGGLLFCALEWNGSLSLQDNPSLLSCLVAGDWGTAKTVFLCDIDEAVAGISQAVFFRTAGFNAIPMGEVSSPANILSVLLMLIGGAPGSMAGGIKTTTLVVVLLTIRAYIRGNPEVQVHRRTISDAICREAMVILFFYLATVFLFYFILLFTEQALIAEKGEFALFYEVTSAIGTVGVTLDSTPLLSPIGRFLISLAMFLGRIGPISLAFMMAGRNVARHIRYPEETISVG